MADSSGEIFKNMFRWAAIHIGAKYPVLSTVGIAIVAAILWNWYFRSVDTEEVKNPTAVNYNQTTGPNSPIIPDNKGTINVKQLPPAADPSKSPSDTK